MREYLLLASIIYGLLLSTVAFKITNIDLELLDDGFQVSIPDEPGLQRVFFMIQIDDTCPAIMDYITEPVKEAWISVQKTNLRNNDKVVISVMVQYNDVIYEKTETKVIINTRMLTTRLSESRNIDFKKSKCKDLNTLQQDIKSCKQAQTLIGNNQPTCQGDLLFEDTFDGGALNRSVWKHDIRVRLYHDEEELVAFDDMEKNCYLKDNGLHIVPTIANEVTEGTYNLGDKCTAIERRLIECKIPYVSSFYIKPPVYSSQIHTRNAFSFKYGRIEVRAKLPKGDWLFPHIMLQPMSTHSETHFAKQLRIAFARGNTHLHNKNDEDISGHRLYGGLVFWQNDRPTQFFRERLSKEHYGDDFHNYTMLWQPDRIDLFVDGESYGEIYDGLEYFNEKCFIIFGVTVGGFLNFDDNVIKEEKPYKNQEPKAALLFWQRQNAWAPTWGDNKSLVIDYVRVYAA